MRSVQFALMTVISAALAMGMIFFLLPLTNYPLTGLLGAGNLTGESSIVEEAEEIGVPEDAWLINPDTHEPGTVPPLDEWLYTPQSGISPLEESFREISRAIDEATR